ncbi:MAG TPA: hypothetical protein VFM18_17205 [Methanosarcina sp.]|nr:hypothetical protein [Methanosarcina sp.]
MYSLYVKTHNKTGLKYLGQTSQNPHEYTGSGLRWLNHLAVHGNDVTTEVIFESEDKIEIGSKGKYYSQLWNVVEDYNWANIVPEEGSGGDTSMCENYAIGMANRDMSYKSESEYLEKVSTSIKKMWQEKFASEEFDEKAYKQMCSERSIKMWENRGISDNDRMQRSNTMLQYAKDHPEYAEQISESVKKRWQEKSELYEITFPDGHTEQIKCLRGWCQDNNYPYNKIYGTLRYNRPSKDGWLAKIVK